MRPVNTYWKIAYLVTLLLVVALPVAADPSPRAISPVEYVYPTVEGKVLRPKEAPGVELSDRGRDLRGVYLPGARVNSMKSRELVYWIEQMGADAVVVDVKDDRGRVTFTHKLTGAMGPPHGNVAKLPELIKLLRERDIYVIGRLVCFKDNQFVRAHSKAGIRDRRSGKIWRDKTEMAWLDPHSTEARDYLVSVAVAAAELGLDEVQLDYVRFPVEPDARFAFYPSRKGNTERYEAIAALLSSVDHAIDLPLSIDVFGLTAYRRGDQEGLGQSLEHLAPYIDAISPMLYLANWPRHNWEDPKPQRTHALVHNAVQRIRARLGDAIAVRPLLQGFKYRAANFGVGFISNQIDAAETAGSSGYLFWNQSGRYSKVSVAWRRLDMFEEEAE